MVTDRMLQEAAGEAERAFLEALEAREIKSHIFSDRFERKMEKLVRKVKHPIRHSVVRSAAAIILLIMTLFGMLFAFSPEVRANVISWFRQTFGVFEQYTPNETTPSDIRYDYALTGIDDSSLLQEIERENGKVLLYRGEGNTIIKFTYTYGSENNEVFVESEGYTVSTIMIGNITADIYITQEDGKNNIIVWEDKAGNAILYISADVDEEALIKFAESVQKREK